MNSLKHDSYISLQVHANDRYNWIRSDTLPVEFELVRQEMEKVDELIRVGQEAYDWNSPGKSYSEKLSCHSIKYHLPRVFRELAHPQIYHKFVTSKFRDI